VLLWGFVLGAAIGVAFMLFRDRASKHGLPVTATLAFTVFLVLVSLSLAFVITSVAEGEPKAGGVGVLIFLLPTLVLGALIWRGFFRRKKPPCPPDTET